MSDSPINRSYSTIEDKPKDEGNWFENMWSGLNKTLQGDIKGENFNFRFFNSNPQSNSSGKKTENNNSNNSKYGVLAIIAVIILIIKNKRK